MRICGAGLACRLGGGVRGQKAVGGTVRHLEDAADARVEQRLAAQGLLERNLLARDAGLGAGGEEAVGIVAFVLRRHDEEAAGVLDAMGVGAAQDAVLLDALDRRSAGP